MTCGSRVAVLAGRWTGWRTWRGPMHELALTQAIVEECAARAEGCRVTKVVVEIGELSAVLPDAVRFCFDLCCEGTPLEGAELEIVALSGTELRVREMEVI